MIELLHNQLHFRFSDVHPGANCSIDFQRTLRIPDDNRDYPLPPGLGRFPLAHVDDFANSLPDTWRQHGGVFLPMYQSEALWINFSGDYPCAIKVAAGKINAVSGKPWSLGLAGNPQDYVVIPRQDWLDGFSVAEGLIRQFVAMPLGEGFSAEEQITGEAEHGGLQVIAYPMKRDVYNEHFGRRLEQARISRSMVCEVSHACKSPDMGLAPGGLMRQKIFKDRYGIDAWDHENGLRCFVHLANSSVYQSITGQHPPQEPPTAKQYTDAGLPWFEHYSDNNALSGNKPLSTLTSVGAKTIAEGKGVLPGNDPIQPKVIKKVGTGNTVRDGTF